MPRPWTRLWSQILDNHFLMADDTAYSVFTKLMLLANDNGEYATSGRELAEFLGQKYTTIYKTLVRLEDQKMIKMVATPRGRQTIIKIQNWQKYQPKTTSVSRQISKQLSEQKQQRLINTSESSRVSSSVSSRYAAGEQPVSSDVQNDRGHDVHQNKSKNKIVRSDVMTTSNYPELEPELHGFVEMRKVIKYPLTDYALTRIVNEVRRLYPNDIPSQKACLDQSTANSYRGVFALHEQRDGAGPQKKSKLGGMY